MDTFSSNTSVPRAWLVASGCLLVSIFIFITSSHSVRGVFGKLTINMTLIHHLSLSTLNMYKYLYKLNRKIWGIHVKLNLEIWTA